MHAIYTFRAFSRFLAAALVIGLLGLKTVTAASLNDTGVSQCYNETNAPVSCSTAVGGDAGINPRQDARYGRDAAALAGSLIKVGAGSAGFDYTKIANNGSTVAASATLGANSTDWACTKDNVTGLVWEVKTTSGLRNNSHTYTWYSTNNTTNGSNAGVVGTNTCGGSLAAAPYSNQCNTQNYVAAVNASGGLCGATDWRLPSLRELRTLVHSGVTDSSAPSIDSAYFPNTNADVYWTRTSVAFDTSRVRALWFYLGFTVNSYVKTESRMTKLVRGAM